MFCFFVFLIYFCLLFVKATMWKFVLLGLAFICLLIGFLLLGMGAMANKYDPQFKTHIFIATSLKRVKFSLIISITMSSTGATLFYVVFTYLYSFVVVFFNIGDNSMN